MWFYKLMAPIYPKIRQVLCNQDVMTVMRFHYSSHQVYWICIYFVRVYCFIMYVNFPFFQRNRKHIIIIITNRCMTWFGCVWLHLKSLYLESGSSFINTHLYTFLCPLVIQLEQSRNFLASSLLINTTLISSFMSFHNIFFASQHHKLANRRGIIVKVSRNIFSYQ